MKPIILSVLAIPIAASTLSAPAATARSAAPGTEVSVTVTQLRNADGLVRACMTTDPARFPQCRDTPQAHRTVIDARQGTVTFTFSGVAPGRYAIALLHDENSNGKADRTLGMMPREGFGFSRDARVRMGPPSFQDAMFEVGETPKFKTIRMRYMF